MPNQPPQAGLYVLRADSCFPCSATEPLLPRSSVPESKPECGFATCAILNSIGFTVNPVFQGFKNSLCKPALPCPKRQVEPRAGNESKLPQLSVVYSLRRFSSASKNVSPTCRFPEESAPTGKRQVGLTFLLALLKRRSE